MRQWIGSATVQIMTCGLFSDKLRWNLIMIDTFSFKKIPLKMSSGKCRPSCHALNVLIHWRGRSRRHLQTAFSNAFLWKKLCAFLLKYCTEVYCQGSSFGSGNGLAPNMLQGFTWTTDVLIWWRTCAPHPPTPAEDNSKRINCKYIAVWEWKKINISSKSHRNSSTDYKQRKHLRFWIKEMEQTSVNINRNSYIFIQENAF